MSEVKDNQVTQPEDEVKQIAAFEIISGSMLDSEKLQNAPCVIDKKVDIPLADVDHFTGRLVKKHIGAFLGAAFISFVVAIILFIVLAEVDVANLNIILGFVFVAIGFIFLLIYAIKRNAKFYFDVYFRKERQENENNLHVNYWENLVNVGDRYPAKVQIISKADKNASTQSEFMSKLSSIFTEINQPEPEPEFDPKLIHKGLFFEEIHFDPCFDVDRYAVKPLPGATPDSLFYGEYKFEAKKKKTEYVITFDPAGKVVELIERKIQN